MPKQGARPGDATGREKERREAEVRPALAEAAQQVTLTNPPRVEPVDTIVDYSQGGAPSVEEAVAGARLITPEEALADDRTAYTNDDLPESALDQEYIDNLPDGTTDVRPQMIERTEEPQPAARLPQNRVGATSEPLPPRVVETRGPQVEPEFRLMRVNADLPDITIGKGNHYTFREDQRYRVPVHVYDHLEEKGYVRH